MELYGRRIRVRIAGLEITKPQIAFQVEREPDETPPEGEVRLWNLTREHASQIYERGGPLTVEAGYGDALSELVNSEAEKVAHTRRDTARITTIEFGGLVSAPTRLGGVTSRSWTGNETIRQIITDVVSDMGLTAGPLEAIPAGETAENWAWSGQSSRALTALTKRVDARWYDDDGVVRFTRRGQATTGAPDLVLSKDTGLIGTPTITDRGANATSLLRPLARIGARVQVESDAVNGSWLVAGLRHEGTNDAAGRFQTGFELRQA